MKKLSPCNLSSDEKTNRRREKSRKTGKITASCDQKGDVGKTVTAVNLGISLAREGERVLLVDVDSQGSLTASLSYQNPDHMENTLAMILGRIISDEPVSLGEGILIGNSRHTHYHGRYAYQLLTGDVELLYTTYGGKLRIFDSVIPLSIREAETSEEKLEALIREMQTERGCSWITCGGSPRRRNSLKSRSKSGST